jgi:hypothetical protein
VEGGRRSFPFKVEEVSLRFLQTALFLETPPSAVMFSLRFC